MLKREKRFSGHLKCRPCQKHTEPCKQLPPPPPTPSPPQRRKRKAWENVCGRQKRRRLEELFALLTDLVIPLHAVLAVVRLRVPPEEVVHLTQAQRVMVRSVPRLRVCSEERVIKWRLALASSHGT